MKKSFILILCMTLLAVSFTLSADAGIKFKETTIDFGEIETGKVIDIVFEFENTGNEILIIKSVNTACGCTATRLEKKEYDPGEKGKLPVKFNSKGYNGRVSKSITLSTNDVKNAYARLTITGKVVLKDFAAVEMKPDTIDFKSVELRKEYKETITLKNTGTIDLRINEVTHNPDLVITFDDKVVKPGDSIKVKVLFTPMSVGRFTSFLKIRTNAFRQRLIINRISAQVEKQLEK